EVMVGPYGALAGTHAGSVIIDMCSVCPHTSRRLFQAARQRGVALIDAAVSGSVPRVEQGSTGIFDGGGHATYRQCKRLLAMPSESSIPRTLHSRLCTKI